MVEHRGQVAQKSETVGEHVVNTFFAEFCPEKLITIQYLTHQRFRRGDIHFPLVHRRARHMPPTLCHVLLHFSEQFRIIFLHHVVPPRTGEIEHIIGIFFKQPEVFGHCIENKLVDGGGVVPVPFGIQVRIAYGVEQPVFFDGVGFHVAQWLSYTHG